MTASGTTAPHSGQSLVGATPFGSCPTEVDVLLERAMQQSGGAEIEDDAIGLDDAGVLLGIHCPKTAADHLDHGRLVGAGPQQHDAGGRLMIPALGQHRDIDHDLDFARAVGSQRIAPVGVGHLAIHHDRTDAVGIESAGDILRVVDRRAEHDGLPVSGLLAPVPDHLIGHRRLVHDRVDLAHVEVGSGTPDLIEIVLDADVDHEGAGLDQMARRNELADPDLVGDIGEHLAQALAVAAVGRCGDTEDANHRIALQRPVDDSPITFGHRMVCFVDHQEIERRHGFEIGSARQCRHHREGDLALPRLLGGIDHRGGQRRIHPGELAAVLLGELVAVGQHTGLGVAVVDHLTGDGRQHDGLAGIVRDGEVAHQVAMVAIDRETIVLAPPDRMRRKAGPQHVLFLAAGRRLFAQHAGRDFLDEAGQYGRANRVRR